MSEVAELFSYFLVIEKLVYVRGSRMIFKRNFCAVVLLWVVMVIMCCNGEPQSTSLDDTVYGNLLIAIQKDVPENETIIHQLQVY